MPIDVNCAARQSDATKYDEHHWHQQAINWMRVVNGIHREISLLLDGVVPAPVRNQRVTELMQAHREHPKGRDDEKAVPFYFQFRSAN